VAQSSGCVVARSAAGVNASATGPGGRFKTDPGGSSSNGGWTVGGGLEVVPWPNLGIDGSGRFRWVNTEDTAIKDLGLYIGVNYYFGS
jgi:opacity protein-like surface antigen